jgi:hypothetical protein
VQVKDLPPWYACPDLVLYEGTFDEAVTGGLKEKNRPITDTPIYSEV